MKIMQKTFMIFLFLSAFDLNVYSEIIIKPRTSISPEIPKFDSEIIGATSIFFLNTDPKNENLLYITYAYQFLDFRFEFDGIEIESYITSSWDFDNQSSIINNKFKYSIFTVDQIDDNIKSKLQDSNGPEEDHGAGRISHYVEQAAISPDKIYVGGIVKYYYYEYQHSIHSWWYKMALWDAKSYKLIYPDDIKDGGTVAGFSPTILELKFTANNHFFYTRELTADSIIVIGDAEYGKDYFIEVVPKVSLLNTETLNLWPADGDVVFTKDGRYMMTVRNGKPSLINTDTGEIKVKYDLPVRFMTAATFSPDEKTLYLAGSDNKIYVFDSGIPSSTRAWEEYHE